MAAELPRFAFAACVDRLLEQEDEIDEAAVMVVSVDDQRTKKLAKLQRFVVGLVPAKRAECLSQTVRKDRRAATAFCEISTSVCRL
ncbi:MAG: hypothetical protein E5Y65_00595 [Mesorhizobium sp.]|uniref:hypothetical protein n=1 Tax=Mesorhizobium sp. TaxID=1871066 RepID=UPI001200777D|nr:hypothetical protein [Mesorhizobium sp.]TIL74235.1 MAG: hypothetical protein E5Y70_12875 [Mesorhizobium sp.]TIL93556.1 MAG: hypothetical protein E5Y65_00595 [Mesorhizobium sp.]TIM02904.1 MAG: hypothetical protein E5Y64_05730 [Mesorhizobium sp.]TIN15773.1 MAG: hypothetical protein E5Y59_10535 [Mesorhizobium sp.]